MCYIVSRPFTPITIAIEVSAVLLAVFLLFYLFHILIPLSSCLLTSSAESVIPCRITLSAVWAGVQFICIFI